MTINLCIHNTGNNCLTYAITQIIFTKNMYLQKHVFNTVIKYGSCTTYTSIYVLSTSERSFKSEYYYCRCFDHMIPSIDLNYISV